MWRLSEWHTVTRYAKMRPAIEPGNALLAAKNASGEVLWTSYSSSADLAYLTYFNDGSVSVGDQRKSRAGSVRCVAE